MLSSIKSVFLTIGDEGHLEWEGREWVSGETCTKHYTDDVGVMSVTDIYASFANGPFVCPEVRLAKTPFDTFL